MTCHAEISTDELRSLADDQLVRLIARGQDVAACKAEWLRRWGRAYPMYRSAEGWEGGDNND